MFAKMANINTTTHTATIINAKKNIVDVKITSQIVPSPIIKIKKRVKAVARVVTTKTVLGVVAKTPPNQKVSAL